MWKKSLERIYTYSISNSQLREIFPKNSIFPAYRRGKNLKEILAPSKFQTIHARLTMKA